MGERSQLRRLEAWLSSLRQAAGLRPRELAASLAVLAEMLRPDGTRLDCPSHGGGGAPVRLTLQLDGGAYLRLVRGGDFANSGAALAMAALGERMRAARATLAVLRSALDAAVLAAAAAATVAAGAFGAAWGHLAWSVGPPLAYAAFAPLRAPLIRAATRAALRVAAKRLALDPPT